MAFKQFKVDNPGGATLAHSVSIRDRGRSIYVSMIFAPFFNNSTYVTLHHDKENNLIGIKPAHGNTAGSRKISSPTGDRNRSMFITSRGFFSFFQITVPEAIMRAPAHWDKEQEMLIVKLPTQPTKED